MAVPIDRTIEQDPALRLETIRLVIEFWHTLCDKLAVDDVGVFRQREAAKLAWLTGDAHAERSWWEQAQALFDYTIEHRHPSKLFNRWCSTVQCSLQFVEQIRENMWVLAEQKE